MKLKGIRSFNLPQCTNLERFELLKSNHENVVKSHQTLFEKHNNEIQKLENIQNQNLEKQIKDFEDTKNSIKVRYPKSYNKTSEEKFSRTLPIIS